MIDFSVAERETLNHDSSISLADFMSCIKSCISTRVLHHESVTKYFKNLRRVAAFLLVVFFLPVFSVAQSGFECTVDGHGPYNLNQKKCLALGVSQAHTNCILKEKEAVVELKFSDSSSKKSGICRSKPLLEKASAQNAEGDCTKSVCSWQGDSAQH